MVPPRARCHLLINYKDDRNEDAVTIRQKVFQAGSFRKEEVTTSYLANKRASLRLPLGDYFVEIKTVVVKIEDTNRR